ncbi:MAG: 50S ribosomal protein L9 [Planctomycetota bacterium]|nr:MAG: 50S ribosomal protein L9 [Planctomycetota bacterium]
MRLLLQEPVPGLGEIGDVVDVRPGYARNYLLPGGFAVAVTPDNLIAVEKRRQKRLAEERARKEELARLAATLAERSVTIRARATGEEGKLYGSVGAVEIAEAFRAEGVPLHPNMVLLEEPIKQLGVYEVPLRLHKELEPVTTKVWVVELKEEA